MIQMPFEDKVDLFSLHSVAKYQWEYACNNTQRITLSASRCNKIHNDFFCPFFCVFLRTCTEVTMCFVHENGVSHSHMASNVFSDFFFFSSLLYVMWSIFTWGLMRYVKRVSVFFNGLFKSVHVTLQPCLRDTGGLFSVDCGRSNNKRPQITRQEFTCRLFWGFLSQTSHIFFCVFFLFFHAIRWFADLLWNCKSSVSVCKIGDTFGFLSCSVSSVCSVGWGIFKHAGQVEHRWILILFYFFPCKTVQFMGKTETSVVVTNFLKSHVCYWC